MSPVEFGYADGLFYCGGAYPSARHPPTPPQEGNPMVPRKRTLRSLKGKKWGSREEIFREYWILLILYPTSRVHCKGNYGNLQYSGPMAVAESCSIQLSGEIYWGACIRNVFFVPETPENTMDAPGKPMATPILFHS